MTRCDCVTASSQRHSTGTGGVSLCSWDGAISNRVSPVLIFLDETSSEVKTLGFVIVVFRQRGGQKGLV